MKVHQLIEILDELDSDGDVFIVVDANYPFEYWVEGVAIREEMVDPDDDQADDGPVRDRWTASESSLPRNDVLIVAGSQARYGSQRAWDAVRRR